MATGTVAFSYHDLGERIKMLVMTWTSTAGGAASDDTKQIYGKLIKAITDPGAAAPTANYDITITEKTTNVNVLSACSDDLVDRHTSNTEEVYFFVTDVATNEQPVHPVVADQLTIAVANAGNAKNGTLYLYYEV